VQSNIVGRSIDSYYGLIIAIASAEIEDSNPGIIGRAGYPCGFYSAFHYPGASEFFD
jgi:hypothetical protein